MSHLSLFIVISVNLQNTMVWHFSLTLPKVMNLLHLLIWMSAPTSIPNITSKNGLFYLLMIALEYLPLLINDKLTVFQLFAQFYDMVQTQFGKSIKCCFQLKVRNMWITISLNLLKNILLLMNLHMLILHNKLVLQKGKIAIYFWSHQGLTYLNVYP